MIPLGTIKKKHRKNPGRRVKREEIFSVRKILEEEMVAFLDTEYLTSQVKGGPPAKLVSIGLVICRKDFKEVDRFHSYIYTEDKLHDVFRELTGITETDLTEAPDYELVMEEVGERLAVWNVTRIFVGTGSSGDSERFAGIPGRYFKEKQKNGKSASSHDERPGGHLFQEIKDAQYRNRESQILMRSWNGCEPRCIRRCRGSEKCNQTY